MAEKKWTPEQRSAIDTKDRTLLVSAAAGSGKTATLTERIISTVLDGEDPASLSDMLIVTFTNAAVAELRARITSAIEGAIAAGGASPELERELLLLPAAHICTIDAFCAELVRQNAERVGITPAFRIADTAEAELLGDSILNGIISAAFDGELSEVASPEELDALTDCLCEARSESSLGETIRFIYEKSINTERGVDSLKELIERYKIKEDEQIADTPFGSYALERARSAAEHHLSVLRGVREELLAYPKAVAHIDAVEEDMSFLRAVLHAEDYNGVREALIRAEFRRTPNKLRDEGFPPLADIRRLMSEEIGGIRADFFSYTDAEWRDASEKLYSLLSVLLRLLKYYDKSFRSQKRARGVCEYSDLERYAYECLWDGDEPSELALSQRNTYTYVYIDEYQDVNGLQAKIFEAVTPRGRGFMVGDIKQSIYGFRNANPDFFKMKKTSFPKLSDSLCCGEAAIFMSDNFRCDKGVIDFVNSVFDPLFSLMGSSIGYMPEDSLKYSKCDEGAPYRTSRVCLIDSATEEDDSDEAAVVARRILEILREERLNDGSPVKPSDIAILLRSTSGERDKKFAAALAAFGIPTALTDEKSFFVNPEILLVLSLLSAIDNPRRDAELCGVMCSPLFSVTPGELLALRRASGAEYLWDALTEYCAAHPECVRLCRVKEFIERYRLVKEGLAADELLSRLYAECGLLSLAEDSGGAARLHRLYDYARSFESASFGGVHAFVDYIKKIMDKRNTALDENGAPVDTDAVRIQTVHSSKGLEYPIVILAGAGSRYRLESGEGRLSYAEGFGLGMPLRTPSGLALAENPMRRAICDYKRRRELEEEARVLYVALTRARESLYVVGKSRMKAENLLGRISLLREALDSHSVYSLCSTMDIILATTGIIPESPEVFAPAAEVEAESRDTESSTADTDSEELYGELMQRFGFTYPELHMTTLPEKLSVSRLYPTVLDGSEDGYELEPEEDTSAPSTPAFISGIDPTESAKRGIATHMLLQFCDLERLAERGAQNELSELVSGGFLSRRDGERVRINEIENFCASELFSAMRGAKRLWRELRFNVNLPADRFTEQQKSRELYRGQTLLVQGVIDCLIEDAEGNLRLIDYKTDRLTKEERENPDLAEARLREAHTGQLSYYADAVYEMLGKRPSRVEVYSLHLGRSVEIFI